MKTSKRYLNNCLEFMGELSRMRLGIYASAVTFFIMLSAIPLLILIFAILPYTSLSESNLMTLVQTLVPEGGQSFVNYIILSSYRRSPGVLSFSAIFALWSGSTGIMAFKNGLNMMHDIPEDRNYFLLRGLCCIYTFILTVVIFGMLIILVFGEHIGRFLVEKIPQTEDVITLLRLHSSTILVPVTIVLFCVMYAYIPNKHSRLLSQLPGAIFSAIAWMVFTYLFSFYTSFGTYTLYGTLTTSIIVMVWLYFCMLILFIGAYLNKFLMDKGVRFLKPKKTKAPQK